MVRQTSVNLTKSTERQVEELKSAGFGGFTDIVRLAIDRLHTSEIGGGSMDLYFYTNERKLQAALRRRKQFGYVVTELAGMNYLYYPACGKQHAAQVLSQVVRESHQIAQSESRGDHLLYGRIDVTTRHGACLAEIETDGTIFYDPDYNPDAAYFCQVLKSTKAELVNARPVES